MFKTNNFLLLVAENKNLDSEPGPSTSKVCTTENDHKTPHSRKEERISRSRTSKRKNSTKQDFESPTKTRRVPLPLMNWADSKEVWMYMVSGQSFIYMWFAKI